MSKRIWPVLTASVLACCAWVGPVGDAAEVVEVIDVAPVWSGHPVGFCLLTHPPHQFAAYYAADRTMTVAQRRLDSMEWTFTRLPEKIEWDSHNYITMTVDDNEEIHLSGNMHVDPLVYFRTAQPLDAATFQRIEHMVGSEEDRTTYPSFFRGPNDKLLFTYRDGKSGSGNQVYNVYDAEQREWRRLLDTPLIDGQGQRNAYLNGPMAGPDGFWHLAWVWRMTPDCATNHYPCYARSRDLKCWEKSDGTPLKLPMTFETAEVVDPVPQGGGIINGNVRLGFDLEQRPIVSYHKYDADGNTQIYNARWEEGAWVAHKASDWDYRWEFSGGGTIEFEVRVGAVRVESGALVQSVSSGKYGSQKWRLDPETLRFAERLEEPGEERRPSLGKVESEFPGMQVRTAGDIGSSGEAGVSYVLRWETLGRNRDRPRPEPWPEPVMMRLYKLKR